VESNFLFCAIGKDEEDDIEGVFGLRMVDFESDINKLQKILLTAYFTSDTLMS